MIKSEMTHEEERDYPITMQDAHQISDCFIDMVNKPPHYQGEVECIDAIASALGKEGFEAFCRGNAIKYIYRAHKKGNYKQDLEKAIWYLKRIL